MYTVAPHVERLEDSRKSLNATVLVSCQVCKMYLLCIHGILWWSDVLPLKPVCFFRNKHCLRLKCLWLCECEWMHVHVHTFLFVCANVHAFCVYVSVCAQCWGSYFLLLLYLKQKYLVTATYYPKNKVTVIILHVVLPVTCTAILVSHDTIVGNVNFIFTAFSGQ